MKIGGGPSPYTPRSESFDGVAWTQNAFMAAARGNDPIGFGNDIDAHICGGRAQSSAPFATNTTEEWNGTSWSSGPNMSYARSAGAGGGTTSSGIVAMGYNATGAYNNNCQEYNGTSFSNGGNPATSNWSSLQGDGNATGAIVTNVENPAKTQTYNGTSWSNRGNMLSRHGDGWMIGDDSDAIGGGGLGPSGDYDDNEVWNGTSWSAGVAGGGANRGAAAGGTTTDMMKCAGTGFLGSWVSEGGAWWQVASVSFAYRDGAGTNNT